MPEMSHGYGTSGPQERLASLRPPRTGDSRPRPSQRSVRIEVLVGIIVVVVGVAVALNVLTSRRGVVQQIQGTFTPQQVVATNGEETLLDGEGLMAVALDDGDFPPGLRPGDSVRVVLSPGPDGQGGFREIGRTLTVRAVDDQSENSGKTVVTVVGPLEAAINLASSGPVRLTIVGRESSK